MQPASPVSWRHWAVRTSLLFALVYVLGLRGVPTLIPYVAAFIWIARDAWRLARQ
jgi:hypothetical protein